MTFSGEREPIGRNKPKWLRAEKRKARKLRTVEGRIRKLERIRRELLEAREEQA